MPSDLFIPSSVSQQAAKFLRAMPKKGSALPSPDELKTWQSLQEILDAFAKPRQQQILNRLKPTLMQIELGGVPCYEVFPHDYKPSDNLLIHIHGGGYCLYNVDVMLDAAALVADKTGYKVLSIGYSLAPFAKHPQIINEVLCVYAELEKQGVDFSNIGVFGDSAGAALACASILKRREQGLALPSALVLWSPWSDISNTGDTYQTLEDADPCFEYEKHLLPCALAYTEEENFTHPYVSPVYGDYTQAFPPTLIQGGTKEFFLSNFVRLYRAMDDAGKEVVLDLYEGMMHVFQQQCPDVPEAQRALQKTGDFFTKYFA